MKPRTTDQKCVAWFEKRGYVIDKAECRMGRVSRDLFGFIDYIALFPNVRPIAIQVTDHTNFSKRKKKILESEYYEIVRGCFSICVLGFKPDEDEPYRKEWV